MQKSVDNCTARVILLEKSAVMSDNKLRSIVLRYFSRSLPRPFLGNQGNSFH